MARPLLSTLPIEVLNQILDYAIPPTRLALHAFLDPEWKRDCAEPRSVPPLLFVNKKLYHQAANVFYTKAILEIAAIKPPGYILNALGPPDASLDLAVSLSVLFAHVPDQHLSLVQTVCVYSDQRDAISAEGYEATLKWLIERTALTQLYLSRRLMTRLRRFRSKIDTAYDFTRHLDVRMRPRYVEIFATHPRSMWESGRMLDMRGAMQGVEPPAIQYFLTGRELPVLLDPRWDARRSDDEHIRQQRQEIAKFVDERAQEYLARSESAGKPYKLPLSLNEAWIYQLCFVMAAGEGPVGSSLPEYTAI